MKPITAGLVGIVVGMLLCSGIAAWYRLQPSSPSLPLQPSKELAHVQKEKLVCQPLVVYRETVKRRMGLPAAEIQNTNRQVVSATQVKASDHPQTISAVANLESGEVSMFARRDPLPWIDFNRRATLGAAYGFKNDQGGAVIRVYGKVELLQVKALHAGLLGDMDNASGRYGGVFIEARW